MCLEHVFFKVELDNVGAKRMSRMSRRPDQSHKMPGCLILISSNKRQSGQSSLTLFITPATVAAVLTKCVQYMYSICRRRVRCVMLDTSRSRSTVLCTLYKYTVLW